MIVSRMWIIPKINIRIKIKKYILKIQFMKKKTMIIVIISKNKIKIMKLNNIKKIELLAI